MSTKSLDQLIGERAYELFLKRGGVHGYAHEDWLQAEKEIKAELKKKEAAKPAAAPAPMAAAVKFEAPAPKAEVKPVHKVEEVKPVVKKASAVVAPKKPVAVKKGSR